MAAKLRRAFAGSAVETTISGALNSGATSFVLTATTGWPYGSDPFYVVVSPGTAVEEKILVTRAGSGDTTVNVVSGGRGADDTVDSNHADGASVYPVFTALDANEANLMTSSLTTKGDLLSLNSSGDFSRLGVGANDTLLVADSAATTGFKWATAGSASIDDDAITTAKILNGAVTAAKLDSAALDSIGARTSFTPDWGGNLTVGNGFNTGAYFTVNDLVFVEARLIFGSTTQIFGGIQFTSPVGNFGGVDEIEGQVIMQDSSGSGGAGDYYYGTLTPGTLTEANIRCYDASGPYMKAAFVTATVPFTWTTNDILYVKLWYYSN